MESRTLVDSQAATSAIVVLGRRQHGVVGAAQLDEMGISRGRVRSRIRVGWLEPMLRGVYALAGARIGAKGYWMAAVLACGSKALLSHASAAELHGLTTGSGAVEVVRTSSGGDSSRRKFMPPRAHVALRVHRTVDLPEADRDVSSGIAVTSPVRTILDLAPGLPAQSLEAMLSRGEELRIIDFGELRERIDGGACRSGLTELDSALERFVPEALEAKSVLEGKAFILCRDHGLPQPLLNVPIGRYVVDLCWPVQGLVVELDGFAFHRDRRSFQGDRSRDVELQLMGLRVVRLTYDDIVNRGPETAEKLRRLLGLG